MKIYVFNKDFLTDWTDGLGVVFADNQEEAIKKMAELTCEGYIHNIPATIAEFRELEIQEYSLDEFPGVYIYGGS